MKKSTTIASIVVGGLAAIGGVALAAFGVKRSFNGQNNAGELPGEAADQPQDQQVVVEASSESSES